jgi:hypothetical protein
MRNNIEIHLPKPATENFKEKFKLSPKNEPKNVFYAENFIWNGLKARIKNSKSCNSFKHSAVKSSSVWFLKFYLEQNLGEGPI